MFVGHFAVAFAAKKAEPRIPLALLFVAVQFADILWPVLILLGVEHSEIHPGITKVAPLDLQYIPYSHSLVMSLIWSLLFALPYALSFSRARTRALRRRELKAALIMAGAVFSHFVLDVVSHRPDMPLSPGSELRVGLGLWNSVAATMLVEGSLWIAGVWLYVRATRAETKMGSWGLGSMVLLLSVSWLMSIFGPPPPGITPAVVSMLVATALILPWARAVDRGRPPATAVPGAVAGLASARARTPS